MSFIFRAFVLVLSLNLISPFVAQPQPLVSSLRWSQSSDEETVRALTQNYALAISGGELEKLRQFWDPQSPHSAARLRVYQGVFSEQRIEFIRMSVTRLEVTGDKAISQLTSDDQYQDKKTGGILSEADAYHGVCRSLEWVRTVAGWKVWREFTVQDELAAKLETASSEQERAEILAKEKVFATDALIRSLGTRGHQYRLRRNYDAALHCYQLQQWLAEQSNDRVGLAVFWLNMGVLGQTQDDYEQALPAQQKALDLFKATKLKRGMAVVLGNLSEIHLRLGDHRQAFDCAQQSLRLYEDANNRKGIVEALNSLANVYQAQNNLLQTLAYKERALAIAQELGNKYQILTLRLGVANQHTSLGNYEQALAIYQDLLKQIEGFGDLGGAAVIREQLGKIYAAQGRHGEALDYYRRALAVFEGNDVKRAAISLLNDMSDNLTQQGKHVEALPLAERAVSLSRQTGLPLDLWLGLTALGYCQLGLNRTTEARQAFSEAVAIIEKLRAQTVGGDEERQRYFEARLRAHHGLLNLLAKDNRPLDALAFAERTKARVLLDVLQQGRVSIQKAMTLEERQHEGRLKSEVARLNTQRARASQLDKPNTQLVSDLSSQLEKARLSYEAFQTSLYAAHPELKTYRGEAPTVTTKELAALLPNASTGLLEYVVTSEECYLFVITKSADIADAEVHLITLPIKRTELTKQTEMFRQQLGARDLSFRAPARQLYQLLLEPARALLRDKTSLIIVPDDKLWELPFQALITESNRYVLETSAVSYAPSLTVLREMKTQNDQRRTGLGSASLLAMGNPVVRQETFGHAKLTRRDRKLDSLPEAEQEVRALGQLYGAARSKVFVGNEAIEDRFKSEASLAGILHFSTHATLNNDAPMYSHLVLAPGNTNEDGLLEAWEIMQMDLQAELAVLSACETARGRFGAGEGMIGLTWALFVSGVPTTVVSQWQVESASTRDLMVRFHRGLNSTMRAGQTKPTKSEALRQAALKLLQQRETSHPFYWAGFVLVGDER